MPTTAPDPFRLDRAAVRSGFERAGPGYDAAAVLQSHVRMELLSRLELVKLDPQVIVDLGCSTGLGARELKRRFRASTVIPMDFARSMLRQTARHSSWLRPLRPVCADALQLPLVNGKVDLLFSSLLLHWVEDLDAALAEVRRVLSPGGFFAFATLGPDTLSELRQAWSVADPGVHVSGFRDMHDVGDALSRAGFSEPVLDVERLTITYDSVAALRRDLKTTGAGNASAARSRGLGSPRRWQRMVEAYEGLRSEGTLPATCEVVYGAAWNGGSRQGAAMHEGEARIPLHAIKRRTTSR